jgi:hypothetical protein
VEIPADTYWAKSSLSTSNGIEVGSLPDGTIGVRNSVNPTHKCACGQEFPALDDLGDHLSMSFPLPRDDIGADGERHYEIAPDATLLQTGSTL